LIAFGVGGAERLAEAVPARGVFISALRCTHLALERCAQRLLSRRVLRISSPPAQLFSLSLQKLNYIGELCPQTLDGIGQRVKNC